MGEPWYWEHLCQRGWDVCWRLAADGQCAASHAGRDAAALCTRPSAGVDYLKYDNCRAKRDMWILDRYSAMRDALNATGRPIVYSLCQWGVMDAHLWSPEIGNSWRTTEVGAVGEEL